MSRILSLANIYLFINQLSEIHHKIFTEMLKIVKYQRRKITNNNTYIEIYKTYICIICIIIIIWRIISSIVFFLYIPSIVFFYVTWQISNFLIKSKKKSCIRWFINLCTNNVLRVELHNSRSTSRHAWMSMSKTISVFQQGRREY